MSRTSLCIVTASLLALFSLSAAGLRYQVMGQESRLPQGPGTYKVTFLLRGKSTGDARITTVCPLDFQRQHIFGEEYTSNELAPRQSESRHGERRQIQWTSRFGMSRDPFQARYEFFCSVDVPKATVSMTRLNKILHAPPQARDHLTSSPGIDPGDPEISQQAQDLTGTVEAPMDQLRSLYLFVANQVEKEPRAGESGLSAADCLRTNRGDSLAKSRLLVALCRNRGIPARLVTGLTLGRKTEQTAHVWAEAWIDDAWLPLCAYHRHFGRVPPTYLVLGFGDLAVVRGKNVRDLNYSVLVQPLNLSPESTVVAGSPLRRFFQRISLYTLPPAEWRLVEFLLLLPPAALIICFFRNLIGLQTFGTFAPALIGLAFRERESLPGLLVFACIVLVGWGLRRLLDRYHLLQTPRIAFQLSLVVLLLISAIVAANYQDLMATRYISLFPLIILTGMIERVWTLEAEDGTASSFKTLLNTLGIAAVISLALGIPAVIRQLVNYPETLGLVMAGQLLIGRYTGYRLTELFRFRDFLQQEKASVEA